MAELRLLRTYRYIDKNPVIDKMRTALQDSGVGVEKKHLKIASELSGLSIGCLLGLFHGETKSPQHRTVMGLMTAIGYREEFVKARDLDIDAERKTARAWAARQPQSNSRKKAKKK